ncbi:MAG: hypothetical protein A2W28_05925 [Gammaproteobacteria bacterium RBG_16_51_14]|nr:MAG: hypothetical protein A2W28_05925 [Gammaproteobacteria bacterium RBG_16_51_14]
MALQQAGDLPLAASWYRRYLRQVPDNTEVLHTLGGLYYQCQDYKAAGEFLRKAQQAAPDNLEYLNDLGAFYLMMGEYANALMCLQHLVTKAPDNPRILYNLGMALSGAGRASEAVAVLEQALRLQPDYAQAQYNLGVLFQDLGHYVRAEEAFRAALRLEPFLPQVHLKLGEVLTRQRRDDAAVSSLQRACELDPDNPAVVIHLAEALRDCGRTEQGIALLQEVLGRHPKLIPILTALGGLLHTAGRINESETVFRQALALNGESSAACLGLSRIRRFSRDDTDIIEAMVMRMLDSQPQLQDPARTNICFALGKIHDDCGDHERAFACYSEANALQHKQTAYDRERHEQRINDTIAVFTGAFLAESSSLGTREKLPVFIVGMPRSGTTLTEQIIASHPQVAGAGELEYFTSISGQLLSLLATEQPYPRCCRSLDSKTTADLIRNYLSLLRRHSSSASLVTDKMPGNYQHLGLIRLLFPQAPIIHCRRDPLDVCLSIFFQHFANGHDYAYDLLDIGHCYLQYARLMAHWRKVLPGPYLEIQYQDLVENQEVKSRALIDFCGLEWNDACLAFHQHQRDIRTASNWQVRQPVFTSSVRRWQHYEKQLRPLIELFSAATVEL